MSDPNPHTLRNQKLGATVTAALRARHFEAHYAATAKEAGALALSLIPENDVVGWGGSFSIQESGLLEQVKKTHKVLDRDTAKTPEERWEIMRQILTCDTFITGTNALAESGELVNIDGNGNRVAAMQFGPHRVIVLAGSNKIVKTLDDAISRTRNTAAPINVQRFNMDTPCSKTGICQDCKNKESICACLSIIRLCRPAGRIKVIICGESLGF